MQTELASEYPELDIQIVGINEIGFDSGNAEMVVDIELPWLQDDAIEEVWETWNVTYRDVWILDAQNEVSAIYNLSENTLANPSNYADLMDIFVDTASQ